MAQADMENVVPKDLVQQLRRESVSVEPKTRDIVVEENQDDTIHVTHNFSQIITFVGSRIRHPFKGSNMRICLHNFLMHWKSILVVAIPLILLPLLVVTDGKEARCAFVVLLMALYWMTEVLPLPVTSLIPIALFPLLNVLSTDEVCAQYFKEVNMMLFGGLAMAAAIEYCNLHERIALKVLLLVGTSPKLLMLGFMMITMFLSMWISNTAATSMTAPIVTAVLKEIHEHLDTERKEERKDSAIEGDADDEEKAKTEEEDLEKGNEEKTEEESITEEEKKDTGVADTTSERLTIGYFLSLSFASNIGGTGTLIGTGTNLIFAGIFQSMFPNAVPINFAAWMTVAVPSMLINTFLGWIWLQVYFLKLFRGGVETGGPEAEKKIRMLIQNKYNSLGNMTQHELSVLILFFILVMFWLFRSPQFITGWGDIVSDKRVLDATPAVLFVLIMFLLPADNKFSLCTGKHEISPPLLTWSVIHKKLPWGLILLLGGGFAMAHGCLKSGLSKLIGKKLIPLRILPSVVLTFVMSFLACCLTQVTSNTSAANIFLPVLAEMSVSIQMNPLYLMIPTTLSCSYAFMLPVGTPPNAIVQAASNMNTSYMMKAGAVMSIISVFVAVVVFAAIGSLVFNANEFPEWAH